jgi:hypothetical protein
MVSRGILWNAVTAPGRHKKAPEVALGGFFPSDERD